MRHAGQLRSRAPLALLASLGLFGLALCVTALPGRAADTPSKPAADTNVRITAVPPAIYVDTAAAAKDDATARASEAKRAPHARTDTDEDFDFDVFTNQMQKTPWVIGLILLVVGSIFLTPVVLLVGRGAAGLSAGGGAPQEGRLVGSAQGRDHDHDRTRAFLLLDDR